MGGPCVTVVGHARTAAHADARLPARSDATCDLLSIRMFSDIVHLQTLSSCIGNCDSGLPVQFGIASIDDSGSSKDWLSDSNNGGAVDLTGSDQGTYGTVSINAYWPDTTAMDNIRGAAADVAGGLETISGNVAHTDSNNAETTINNNADVP